MRSVAISLLLAVVACGGAQKPADSPADTSSLESGGGSSAPDPKASPASASGDSTSAASASNATGTPSGDGASDTESGKGGAAGALPTESGKGGAASAHPTPAVTGSIDGKPFTPKLARITSKMQKDGRVTISIDDSTDCTDSNDATLTITVPWEDGYKVDLGSLKRATKKGKGEIAFSRAGASGKKEVVKAFKPSGTVTVVKAPTVESATGKMKIDLQSGDYILAGDLDVQVCVAPK